MSNEYFVKDANPGWEECSSLEEWMRTALQEGQDAQVVALLRCLPDSVKEKYRKIWAEVKAGGTHA